MLDGIEDAVGLIGGMRSEWPPIPQALPTPLAAALAAAGLIVLLAAPVVVAVAFGRPMWLGGVAFLRRRRGRSQPCLPRSGGGGVAHVLGTGADIVAVMSWMVVVFFLAWFTPRANRAATLRGPP